MASGTTLRDDEVALLEQLLDGACHTRKDLTQLARSKAYATLRKKVQGMRERIVAEELAAVERERRGQS